MKRVFVASIFTLVFLFAFLAIPYAEMAKEGTDSGTNYYACTRHAVPIDENREIMTYECLGMMNSDSGGGSFHNMSTRNFGVIYFEKGIGRLDGYVIFTDPGGDKTVAKITGGHILPAPNPSSVTGKFIGGTGKFEGITGAVEYPGWYVRSPAEKTQALTKTKISWKLP